MLETAEIGAFRKYNGENEGWPCENTVRLPRTQERAPLQNKPWETDAPETQGTPGLKQRLWRRQ
jgi:hypothetical protein